MLHQDIDISLMRFITLLMLSFFPAVSLRSEASTCFGTPNNGRIEGAVALPTDGRNFKAYSLIGVALRRNFVDEKVRDVVVAAYELLEKRLPKVTFVYGETGWPKGGRFAPHKTHQNGLSVDFMVPVRNSKGEAVEFPSSVKNKWGYNLEFDANGRLDELRIDFNAVAMHLQSLEEVAKKSGILIRQVIFEPEYQDKLRAAPAWKNVGLTLYPKKVWIRHDEHYHVDFGVNCKP